MFKSLAAAAIGLVAVVAAQDEPFNPILSPNRFEVWEPGSSQTITWTVQPAEFADETVTLTLIGGPEQDLQVPLLTIAENVANSDEKYEWDLPEDIGGKAWYGISMVLDSDPTIMQFSNPFNITAPSGGSGDDSSSSAAPEPTTSTADDAETTTTVPTDSETDSADQTPVTSDSTFVTSSTGTAKPTDSPNTTGVTKPTDEPTRTGDDGDDAPAETSTLPTGGAARATGGVAALMGVAAVAVFAL